MDGIQSGHSPPPPPPPAKSEYFFFDFEKWGGEAYPLPVASSMLLPCLFHLSVGTSKPKIVWFQDQGNEFFDKNGWKTFIFSLH